MARTKHTNPDELRARSRLLEPYEARGKDHQTTLRSTIRALKESGIFLDLPEIHTPEQPARPRIICKAARKGFAYPVSKQDIYSVIDFFGHRCFYGLKTIRLSPVQESTSSGVLMGRLEVPGTIILYEQPESPWLIGGVLPEEQQRVLERAGAVVEVDAQAFQTVVRWSALNLKNYVLFDVLMHEVGHHMLQHYKGKRNVRIARTKDHEAFANLFASRCREAYLQSADNQELTHDQ